jgi:hypothetical protein
MIGYQTTYLNHIGEVFPELFFLTEINSFLSTEDVEKHEIVQGVEGKDHKVDNLIDTDDFWAAQSKESVFGGLLAVEKGQITLEILLDFIRKKKKNNSSNIYTILKTIESAYYD